MSAPSRPGDSTPPPTPPDGPPDDALAETVAPSSRPPAVVTRDPDASGADATIAASPPAGTSSSGRAGAGGSSGRSGAGGSSGRDAAVSAVDATMAAAPATERRPPEIDSYRDTIAAGSSRPTGPGGAGDRGPTADDLPVADPAQYIAEREVARGGMGRIVAATDRILGRPVALKELLAPDPEQSARFRREALITARLQHPAIVPVYQAGRWPSGEPFYAMKLVAGQPLDRVIADAGSLRERLALLPSIIAAVDAIAYAHSRRVVHRDLKPANVLVGDFGEIVVIDWGLAKDLDAPSEDDMAATTLEGTRPAIAHGSASGHRKRDTDATTSDSASLTVAGAVMGTPAYMPPEQARGDAVDERADVFSLGAMLYHLLAGAPPYAARTATDVIAHAIAGKVVPLEERVRDAPADLVAIVTRAMAHEPDQRYASAQELAEELRRFQTGQLVGAHHYTVRERLIRFVRRHRAAVAIAAVALVAFAVLGTLALRRIVAERDRANAQRQLADQRRAAAEGMVDFLVSDMKAKLGTIGRKDLLAGMGAQIRDYYRELDGLPGGMTDGDVDRMAAALLTLGEALSERGDPTTALAALADGRRRLERLLASHPDDPRALQRHRTLADVLVAIGRLQHSRGEYDTELATYRTALEQYGALLTRDPDDRHALLGSAGARDLIADVERNRGRIEEAAAEYAAAMAARQRVVDLGGGADPEATAELATSHFKLGSTHYARGDSTRTLAEYRAAERLREQLVASDPENTAWALDLVRARTQVADTERELGHVGEAEAYYQKALDLIDRLLRKDEGNTTWRRERGNILSNWGYALIDRGDPDAAATLLDQALANHTALVTKDPDNTSWQIDVSRMHYRLGDTRLWRGQLPAALDQYRAARTIRMGLLARDPKNPVWRRLVAWADSKVSYASWMAGDLDTARASAVAALDARTELSAAAPDQAIVKSELALSEVQMARVEARAGRVDDGLVAADRAVATFSTLVDNDPINVEWKENLVNALLVRIDLRLKSGDVAGAVVDAERAVTASQAAAATAAESVVWPALLAEAQWLRARGVRALGRSATDDQRATADDDLRASHATLSELVRDHRLSADKLPLWNKVRAARRP